MHDGGPDGRYCWQVENPMDRRDVLRGGLFLGLAAVLEGCASQTQVPGPVWPGEGGGAGTAWKPSGPSLPPTPVPSTPTGYYALPSNVIPRSRWTSQGILASRLTANGDAGRMGTIQRITVHHDAIDNSGLRSEGDVIRRLNQVRQGHITRRPEPFADIGYHFVIDPQGRVWEARPLYYQGAHVKGQNENNMGVMVLGHFDINRPTPAATAALEAFIVQQMQRYGVPLSRVKTHQEMASTECPGRNLQRNMLAARTRGGTIYRA
jgi:hypothetical protein